MRAKNATLSILVLVIIATGGMVGTLTAIQHFNVFNFPSVGATSGPTLVNGRHLGFWIADDDIYNQPPPTPQEFFNYYFMTAPYPSTLQWTTGLYSSSAYGVSSTQEAEWFGQLLSIADSYPNIQMTMLVFLDLSGYSIVTYAGVHSPDFTQFQNEAGPDDSGSYINFTLDNLSPSASYNLILADDNNNTVATLTSFTTTSVGSYAGDFQIPNETESQNLWYVTVQGTSISYAVALQADQTWQFTNYMDTIAGNTALYLVQYEPEYFGNDAAENQEFCSIVTAAGYECQPADQTTFPAINYSTYPYYGGAIYTTLTNPPYVGVGYGEVGTPSCDTQNPCPIWTQTSVTDIVDESAPNVPFTYIYSELDTNNPAGDSVLWNSTTLRDWIWNDPYYQANYVLSNSSPPTTVSSSSTSSSALGFISIQASSGPYSSGTPITFSGQTLTSSSGSATPSQTIYIWINGKSQGSVTSSTSGSWTFSFTPSTSGTYYISASQDSNGAGITSQQLSFTVTSGTTSTTTTTSTTSTSGQPSPTVSPVNGSPPPANAGLTFSSGPPEMNPQSNPVYSQNPILMRFYLPQAESSFNLKFYGSTIGTITTSLNVAIVADSNQGYQTGTPVLSDVLYNATASGISGTASWITVPVDVSLNSGYYWAAFSTSGGNDNDYYGIESNNQIAYPDIYVFIPNVAGTGFQGSVKVDLGSVLWTTNSAGNTLSVYPLLSEATNFRALDDSMTIEVPQEMSVNMISFFVSDRAYDPNNISISLEQGSTTLATGMFSNQVFSGINGLSYAPVQLSEVVTLMPSVSYTIAFGSLPSNDDYSGNLGGGISQDLITSEANPTSAGYLGQSSWALFTLGLMNVNYPISFPDYISSTDMTDSPGYQGDEVALRFLATQSETIQSFSVGVISVSTLAGSLSVTLRADDGGRPTPLSVSPALASGSVSYSSVNANLTSCSTNTGECTFAKTYFSGSTSLTAGDYYWIVMSGNIGLNRLVSPYSALVYTSPNDFQTTWGVPADGPSDLAYQIVTSGQTISNTYIGETNFAIGQSNIIAQSFSVPSSISLAGIWIHTGRDFNLNVAIETNGASNSPSGTAVGIAALPFYSASDSMNYASFSSPITLSANTEYWIVVSGTCAFSACSSPEYIYANQYQSSDQNKYDGFTYVTSGNGGSTWTAPSQSGDMPFILSAYNSSQIIQTSTTTTSQSTTTSTTTSSISTSTTSRSTTTYSTTSTTTSTATITQASLPPPPVTTTTTTSTGFTTSSTTPPPPPPTTTTTTTTSTGFTTSSTAIRTSSAYTSQTTTTTTNTTTSSTVGGSGGSTSTTASQTSEATNVTTTSTALASVASTASGTQATTQTDSVTTTTISVLVTPATTTRVVGPAIISGGFADLLSSEVAMTILTIGLGVAFTMTWRGKNPVERRRGRVDPSHEGEDLLAKFALIKKRLNQKLRK